MKQQIEKDYKKGSFFIPRWNSVFHDPVVRWVPLQIRQSPAFIWAHPSFHWEFYLTPNPQVSTERALLPLTKVIFAEVFHDVIIIFISVFAGITDLGCCKCKGQSPSGSGRKEQQVALGPLRKTPVSHPSVGGCPCALLPLPAPALPEHCDAPYLAADPLEGGTV